MPPQKNILITGNHHTPALELVRQLKLDKEHHWKIYYISHLNHQETHITHSVIRDKSITFFDLPSGKYDRTSTKKTVLGLFLTLKAIIRARQLILQIQPDIIVSFGGYSSVPVAIASWLTSTPSITHEQTLTISLATKINSIFCTKVALSFSNTNKNPSVFSNKTVITGNLLRYELFQENPPPIYIKKATESFKLPLIYVTGGNQGSQIINKSIITALPHLSDYAVIHQVGPTDIVNYSQFTTPKYFPVEFVSVTDLGWIFKHSSLIISRSGANICQEIVAFGKSSILIPLPFSQQSEQQKNANWVRQHLPKNTIIIPQTHLSSTTLLQSIQQIQSKKQVISKTIPCYQPSTSLINLIHELVKS